MSRTVIISLDIAHLSEYQQAIEAIPNYLNHDDKLILMTVIENVSSGYISAFLPKDIGNVAEAAAKEDLKAFSKKHFPEFKEKKHIVGNGNVYESVLEISLRTETDLIIALERNAKHHDIPIFGPNSARIARHASCSVLILR